MKLKHNLILKYSNSIGIENSKKSVKIEEIVSLRSENPAGTHVSTRFGHQMELFNNKCF